MVTRILPRRQPCQLWYYLAVIPFKKTTLTTLALLVCNLTIIQLPILFELLLIITPENNVNMSEALLYFGITCLQLNHNPITDSLRTPTYHIITAENNVNKLSEKLIFNKAPSEATIVGDGFGDDIGFQTNKKKLTLTLTPTLTLTQVWNKKHQRRPNLNLRA